MSDKYLIWSNEHRAWWRPNRSGYTSFVQAAGRYTREEAITESRTRYPVPPDEVPGELPIREDDVRALEFTVNPS